MEWPRTLMDAAVQDPGLIADENLPCMAAISLRIETHGEMMSALSAEVKMDSA